jgi:hypothetical protein
MAGQGYRTFSSGEVLTAANLQGYAVDQSVMVFATSAARTTALPSASTGMMSYLVDTGRLQVATGPTTFVDVPLVGGVLQCVFASTSANTSGNTAIPLDNTIPQITEGVEMLTASITPKSATSNLLIQAQMYFGETANGANYPIAALFRDSTANAIATSQNRGTTGSFDSASPVQITHSVASSSTTATTFKVRCGMDTLQTIVLNGVTINTPAYSSPLFGGTYRSTLTIWEIQA